MHRFYTTAETRQALISESNRLIAARAAANAARPTTDASGESFDHESPPLPGETDSAFDRLVSELLRDRRTSVEA